MMSPSRPSCIAASMPSASSIIRSYNNLPVRGGRPISQLITPYTPSIITVQAPKMDRQSIIKRTVAALEATGLQIYHYTIRTSISLFCAMPSDIRFIGDTDKLMELQTSATGTRIDPSADADKVAKRSGIFCIAEGAGSVNVPSSGGKLNVADGLTAKTAVHDTGGAGDGMAAAKMSFAKKWLEAWGIRATSRIFAFYAQVVTQDYYFKGVVVIHRDHEYPGPKGSDIVFDEASLSRQLLCADRTYGKILPIRISDDNTGMTQIEYLMQGETFTGFTDPKETAPNMLEQAKALDKRFYQEAREGHRQNMESEKNCQDGFMDFTVGQLDNETLYWEIQPEDTNVHLSRAKSRDDRMVNISLAASYRSMFANPHATSRLVGRMAATWRSKILRPKRGKNTTLPMLMVHGREVVLAHWYYAGVKEPPPGHLALAWRNGIPVMAVPNEIDFHGRNRAMDTWDNDSDKLTLAWMTEDENHGALALRSPMSVDGGTWFLLLDDDVEKINNLGDGWTAKTGGHRWGNLYDVDKDGNPVRPSVVRPTPFDSKPSWNSTLKDPQEVLEFLLERNKYAGAIGMASNYAANIDLPNQFDPLLHLFCLSDDVIDGTGNPENLLAHLREEVYRIAKSGTPMCNCVWGRVAGEMNKIHREKTEDRWANLTVRTKCPEHHGLYHHWSSQAVEYLEQKLQTRQLCANGPLNRLTMEHDELLTAIVREAFAKRNAAWRNCLKREEALRGEAELSQYVRTAYGPRPSRTPTSRRWTPPTQRTPRPRNSRATSTGTSPTSGSNWNSTAAGASRRERYPLPSPSWPCPSSPTRSTWDSTAADRRCRPPSSAPCSPHGRQRPQASSRAPCSLSPRTARTGITSAAPTARSSPASGPTPRSTWA